MSKIFLSPYDMRRSAKPADFGVSVVVPAYNEAGNIEALSARIDAALRKRNIPYELIVIDDHSTDGTPDVVRACARAYPVRLLFKEGKKGKAYSLWQGFPYASYSTIGIIDADLQYPPEAIPEMVEKILRNDCDIVVANRVAHETSFARKAMSRGFAFVFGRMLHGLACDVQSGLKVFRREVVREVRANPTPWTFDLEFLLQAREAGYRISTVDILFAERSYGVSNIRLVAGALEIGWNAIRMKFARMRPIIIPPHTENTMLGAGIAHRGRRFVTHTTLGVRNSAIHTFNLWQKGALFTLGAGLIASLWYAPLTTGIAVTAVLSAIYFADMLFNLYLVLRSIKHPPEITFSDDELAVLDHEILPMYSVLCPLYREASVLPEFLAAVDRLDWPKEKLDVILLLEEDDAETIAAASSIALPPYVRMVIVPHGAPKTKPKACNYGLSLAAGDYLVIYDAEDHPDPQQLKKAYLGFRHLHPNVKCLQAKLNYYNPHQNFLTRLFTAEYSLWFDVTLTGLQAVKGYIPLGGTSNHFRTEDLRMLEGWDPFNVTEDCDLGARIFKRGFETAIIDSVTLEEANSRVWNWLRQRSRWIKGYMQTYLVHMRHPIEFLRENGRDALMFQLVVGGKIMFLLINPLLWLLTASYFALYALVGPTIETLYPTAVFYMAATSLIFGNFLYIFYYMIGCAKRGHWSLMKYIFFIPAYWLMASTAAVIAAYQLFVKPHYWEKTQHGLETKKAARLADVTRRAHTPAVPAPVPVLASRNATVREPETVDWMPPIIARLVPAPLKGTLTSRAGILVVAMMASNFVNFVFNAFLGRALSFEDLALVTLVNTLWSIAGIFVSAVGATVNHRTAFLSATGGDETIMHFLRRTIRQVTGAAIFVSCIWLLAAPLLNTFFRIGDPRVLLLVTPAFTLGVLTAANRGFLQGKLAFASVAVTYLTETIAKFAVAAVFVFLGMDAWVYLAIPISIAVSALIAWLMARRLFRPEIIGQGAYEFPQRFYTASIMTGVSIAAFLSLDVILAKHFLDPAVAGQYALLALVGKMIFFFGALPATFLITFVSRDEGLGVHPRRTLARVFGVTVGLVAVGVFVLGPFGHITVPLLLGAKTVHILDYLNWYTVAIGLFTLTNVIVSYHLARRQYLFPVVSLGMSLMMVIGIWIAHSGVGDIVSVIVSTSVFGFIAIITLHLAEKRMVYVARAVRDLVELFVPEPHLPLPAGKRRILIMNWRDVRHVHAGGAEVYVHGMAREWASQGHQVTIFSGNDGHAPREEWLEGVRVIRRGGFYFVYLWAFLYYMMQFRRRFDVVIDSHNGVPFFTPLYVSEPVYCIMHHVHQEVFRRSLPRALAELACFLERDVMRLMYRNVKIVTVSDSSRVDIEELGITRAGVEVVSPGVDLVRLVAGEKSQSPLMLYLGRLKAYKSIDVAIMAFKIVRDTHPDARLVIAGSGEEQAHLERLAEQIGVADDVYFAGKVNDDQKIQLLQNAWVMVNPSFMEGWGITTIEANACGTPVVAADVPGLRDSVRDMETGYLVPHGDTVSFASRITAIIEDRKLREQLTAQSLAWAKQFNWREKSELFLQAIKIRS